MRTTYDVFDRACETAFAGAIHNDHESVEDGHGQRFQYVPCKRTCSDRPANPLGDMRLSLDRAMNVPQLPLEGTSVRATMRVTGVSRNTILDLLVHVGDRCELLLEDRLKGVTVAGVRVDGAWGYVFCKEKMRTRKYEGQEEVGDAYCFIGIERTTPSCNRCCKECRQRQGLRKPYLPGVIPSTAPVSTAARRSPLRGRRLARFRPAR